MKRRGGYGIRSMRLRTIETIRRRTRFAFILLLQLLKIPNSTTRYGMRQVVRNFNYIRSNK